jgi:hypothetical protein
MERLRFSGNLFLLPPKTVSKISNTSTSGRLFSTTGPLAIRRPMAKVRTNNLLSTTIDLNAALVSQFPQTDILCVQLS